MVKVQLTCSRVNGDMSTNVSGDKIDVDIEEAKRLIDNHFAIDFDGSVAAAIQRTTAKKKKNKDQTPDPSSGEQSEPQFTDQEADPSNSELISDVRPDADNSTDGAAG